MTQDYAQAFYQPWKPMRDPQDLKTLGKLGEELGEASAAVSRCIIQGIDECEPTTGKQNRQWLLEELADVRLNAELVQARFGISEEAIQARMATKRPLIQAWHQEAT